MAGLILSGAWVLLSFCSLIICISYKRNNDIMILKIRELIDYYIRDSKGQGIDEEIGVSIDELTKDLSERKALDQKYMVWELCSIFSSWASILCLIIFMGMNITF